MPRPPKYLLSILLLLWSVICLYNVFCNDYWILWLLIGLFAAVETYYSFVEDYHRV